MSINFTGSPVSGGADIARVVKQTTARIGTDLHGQLSATEFENVLTNMLEGLNKTASPTFPTGSTATVSPVVTAPASTKAGSGS